MLVVEDNMRLKPFSTTAAVAAMANHAKGFNWRYCRGAVLGVKKSY
jgi:hypothetical protein